jgi:hypothetical protein
VNWSQRTGIGNPNQTVVGIERDGFPIRSKTEIDAVVFS